MLFANVVSCITSQYHLTNRSNLKGRRRNIRITYPACPFHFEVFVFEFVFLEIRISASIQSLSRRTEHKTAASTKQLVISNFASEIC